MNQFLAYRFNPSGSPGITCDLINDYDTLLEALIVISKGSRGTFSWQIINHETFDIVDQGTHHTINDAIKNEKHNQPNTPVFVQDWDEIDGVSGMRKYAGVSIHSTIPDCSSYVSTILRNTQDRSLPHKIPDGAPYMATISTELFDELVNSPNGIMKRDVTITKFIR